MRIGLAPTTSVVMLGLSLLVLTLVNGIWWSSQIPFDRAPDESEHHAVYAHVAETGELPTWGNGFGLSLRRARTGVLYPVESFERLRCDPYGFSMRQPYIITPQLPYLVGGLAVRLIDGGSNWELARFINTLWLAIAVLAVFGAGLTLWPGRFGMAAACAATFAWWPQMTFLGAYVNDDMFAVAASTILLLGVIRIDRRGPTAAGLVPFWLGAMLVLSSKYYTFPLLLLVATWWLRGRRLGRGWMARVGGAGAAGVLGALPWPVRNLELYGDLTGLRFVAAAGVSFIDAMPDDLRRCTILLRTAQVGFDDMWRRGWWRQTFESFWGYFGWVDHPLPPVLYVLVLVVVGWTLSVVLRNPGPAFKGAASPVPAMFGFPLFAMLLALSVYNTMSVDFQAQGRYLLPACAPLLLHLFHRVQALGSGPIAVVPALVVVVVFALENVLASRFFVG